MSQTSANHPVSRASKFEMTQDLPVVTNTSFDYAPQLFGDGTPKVVPNLPLQIKLRVLNRPVTGAPESKFHEVLEPQFATKKVSALQESKRRGRYEEAPKVLDLLDDPMRYSKDLVSSGRPQTTKAGTISSEVREISTKGFFQSPPLSLQSERRSQAGLKLSLSRGARTQVNHVMSSLQQKHAASIGSPTFMQSSQQYKLAKNLPDIFRQRQQTESQARALEFASRILSPVNPTYTPRRGMSAGHQRKTMPIHREERIPEHDFCKALSCLTDAASATNSLGPHPDPFKYAQAKSHVKVPEFLKNFMSKPEVRIEPTLEPEDKAQEPEIVYTALIDKRPAPILIIDQPVPAMLRDTRAPDVTLDDVENNFETEPVHEVRQVIVTADLGDRS